MLAHVLDKARKLGPQRIVVVVGHGADRVKQAFADQQDIQFALQSPQQGTGHAVQQAVPFLLDGGADDSATLVLYGDVPLVQSATLQGLLDARGGGMAVLTEKLDDPSGRSEEHTSELQSLMRISYAVFCLKKKKTR